MIKQLEGTYQIGSEELGNIVVIENPSIYIDTVADRVISKTCNVHVMFRDVSKGLQYEEIIPGFRYDVTWDDPIVEEWLMKELNNYKINN
jgi:hypothetical protein